MQSWAPGSEEKRCLMVVACLRQGEWAAGVGRWEMGSWNQLRQQSVGAAMVKTGCQARLTK